MTGFTEPGSDEATTRRTFGVPVIFRTTRQVRATHRSMRHWRNWPRMSATIAGWCASPSLGTTLRENPPRYLLPDDDHFVKVRIARSVRRRWLSSLLTSAGSDKCLPYSSRLDTLKVFRIK